MTESHLIPSVIEEVEVGGDDIQNVSRNPFFISQQNGVGDLTGIKE